MAVPSTIGVVGAGTMGAGIAQLAGQAGARTLLHDPDPDALERGIADIAARLERSAAKGRITDSEAAEVRERIESAPNLDVLAPCGLVIEAAPERLELKLELFGRLAQITAADCVLATNTSSLSVTEIGAGTPGPERVVGLHFFNPAPVMRLVEVVPGAETAATAVATARAAGEAMGKRVIDAADIPGFLVNRVNRPFSLEALRILQGRSATVEQIDRIARLAGGFRMGPFELMDLIGIDTNHAVAEAFYRQSYGEPRYRPSPLAARKVAAGTLGRKTGRGWYAYRDQDDHRAADPAAPERGGGDGRPVAVSGAGPTADALRGGLTEAGFAVTDPGDPWLSIDCGGDPVPSAHRLVLLDRGSLHRLDPEAAGFFLWPPLRDGGLIELATTARTSAETTDRVHRLVSALGQHHEEVADWPGLVLGRIVSQLVNEAAFLIGEGNGTAEDIDAGMELGVNHPRGPVAWSRALGLPAVLAILDALHDELGEERYRAAPLLRRQVDLGAGLDRGG